MKTFCVDLCFPAQVDVLTAALRATALDSGLEDAFLEPRAAQSNPFSSQHSSERRSDDTQVNTPHWDHVDALFYFDNYDHIIILVS